MGRNLAKPAPARVHNTLAEHISVSFASEVGNPINCPAHTESITPLETSYDRRSTKRPARVYLAEPWGPEALFPFLAALLRCALCEHAPLRG